ncbi:MAG: glycosyltransferase family 2 protein [Nitrospirae bacterium]|nr:glycosyltransferase family 2 protein [Nitrospirota bacterium]
MRDKVSVTIITQNEEGMVRGCLESVRWAAEIVVVDAESTDRTAAIAHEYTEKVFVKPWLGFAEQKNLALSEATCPWVLSLDADERVTPDLAAEILDALKAPDADGYYVPRKNFFGGRWIRHGGWYPDYTLRLFKRTHGSFGDREVHEGVVLNGRSAYLRHPLVHETYKDLSDYLARMDRYSSLAARELRKRGSRFRLWHLFFRPPAAFVKHYLLKQGFRDGADGLLLAALQAMYTFAKYAKLYEMEQADRKLQNLK